MAETKPWDALRKPFKDEQIGEMPRGGVKLKYVGHANITARLNEAVGPENWDLSPLAFNEDGTPVITTRKDMAVMWAKLTILGATKLCVGTAQISKMEVEKELIGDALRNGAMRFGVALDLWSKEELESHDPESRIMELTGPITPDQITTLKGSMVSRGIKTTEDAKLAFKLWGDAEAAKVHDLTKAQAHNMIMALKPLTIEQVQAKLLDSYEIIKEG